MRAIFLVLTITLYALSGCTAPPIRSVVEDNPAKTPATNGGTAARQGPRVVLVTLDGLPARALRDPRLPMPTLRRMQATGVHADAMQPINSTITWPNHATRAGRVRPRLGC